MSGVRFVFSAGVATSAPVDCGIKGVLLAIRTPASLVAVSATLQGSEDGVTYTTIGTLSTAAANYTLTLNATAMNIPVDDKLTQGFRWLRLVLNAGEAGAVNIDAVIRNLLP